jgi:hypothetical protein
MLPGTTLIYKKVVPCTKCKQQIFQTFFGPKLRYLDRYKYPKRNFFEFFSSISWRLCASTEGEKVVLYFSDLVPVLKVKIKFSYFKYSEFTFSTGTKSVKYHFFAFSKVPKISKKNFQKKFFLGIYTGRNTLFLDPKFFEKFAYCIWYLELPFKNKIKKQALPAWNYLSFF